jgi:hypothetical protein
VQSYQPTITYAQSAILPMLRPTSNLNADTSKLDIPQQSKEYENCDISTEEINKK